MLDDLPPCRCASCGALCRCDTNGDGIEGCYCTADGCEMRGRNQRHLGRPGVEVEFGGDWSHRFTAHGRPSQGETNTPSVSRTFLFVLERNHGIKSHELKVWGRTKDAPPGVDAECRLQSGYLLRMQVTRALPREVKARWGHDRAVEFRRPIDAAVCMLFETIAKKSEHYRARNVDTSAITLLIDGIEAPQLALPAPTLFEPTHGDWARALGWESIWVIGSTFAKRLDWEPELPRVWTEPTPS